MSICHGLVGHRGVKLSVKYLALHLIGLESGFDSGSDSGSTHFNCRKYIDPFACNRSEMPFRVHGWGFTLTTSNRVKKDLVAIEWVEHYMNKLRNPRDEAVKKQYGVCDGPSH
jgi:hypothetical protein